MMRPLHSVKRARPCIAVFSFGLDLRPPRHWCSKDSIPSLPSPAFAPSPRSISSRFLKSSETCLRALTATVRSAYDSALLSDDHPLYMGTLILLQSLCRQAMLYARNRSLIASGHKRRQWGSKIRRYPRCTRLYGYGAHYQHHLASNTTLVRTTIDTKASFQPGSAYRYCLASKKSIIS